MRERLVDEAQAAGAQLHPLADGVADAATRRFPLIAVTNAADETALMQEEIFGPLLPIVPYDTLADAVGAWPPRATPLIASCHDVLLEKIIGRGIAV